MKNLSRYFFKNKRDFLMTILGDVLLALSMVAWSFFMKNLAEAAEQIFLQFCALHALVWHFYCFTFSLFI